MGVKSEVQLTRQQAEHKYLELKYRLDKPISNIPDDELKDLLEEMNDSINDGEGFENYRII